MEKLLKASRLNIAKTKAIWGTSQSSARLISLCKYRDVCG